MTVSSTPATTTSDQERAAPAPTRRSRRRQNLIGWLFVAPFGIVFMTMLISRSDMRSTSACSRRR